MTDTTPSAPPRRSCVYLIGDTEQSADNRRCFATAALKLRRKGYDVINPAELRQSLPMMPINNIVSVGFALIDSADTVCTLVGWRLCKTARYEYKYAVAKGKVLIHDM